MNYEVIEGEIPEGWMSVEPNCRAAPIPLAGARFAKRQIEEKGGKAVIVKRNGAYEVRPLERI